LRLIGNRKGLLIITFSILPIHPQRLFCVFKQNAKKLQNLESEDDDMNTITNGRKIGEVDFTGLRFGSRKAYIRQETENERIWREDKIFKYCPRHCFRLTLKFQDGSSKHFSIFADNKEEAIRYAPEAVQDLVDSLGLERVVWCIEGGEYHISSARVKLFSIPNKSKIREWKERINEALEKFFFVEDLD